MTGRQPAVPDDQRNGPAVPEQFGSTRLTLTRHGETVWHADNRYAGGASDIDLTEHGHRQATTLARWALSQDFAAVAVSPVRRALETARPVAAALGVALDIVPELQEVDFGLAEGRTVVELLDLDAEMVHRFHDDPVAHPWPGAEAPQDAADRAQRALRALAAAYPGQRVLVVAHNTLLRLGLCALLDLPVARYRSLFPRLDNGALSEVSVPLDGSPAGLLSLNDHPLAPYRTPRPAPSLSRTAADRPRPPLHKEIP